MNPVAEMALANARARLARPVVMADVTVPEADSATTPEDRPKAPSSEHFSHLLYLEGRRHAADIVRDAKIMLREAGWARELASAIRRAAEGRPASFAKGLLEVVELIEQAAEQLEVAHG